MEEFPGIFIFDLRAINVRPTDLNYMLGTHELCPSHTEINSLSIVTIGQIYKG